MLQCTHYLVFINDSCIVSQDLEEFKLLTADTHHKGGLTTKPFAYFQEICQDKNFLNLQLTEVLVISQKNGNMNVFDLIYVWKEELKRIVYQQNAAAEENGFKA